MLRILVINLVFSLLALPAVVSAQQTRVHVNQVGFLPQASKIAVVPNVHAGEFWLIDAKTKKEVLRGPLTQEAEWDMAGEVVKLADFTAFDKPGRYYIQVDGAADSHPFEIRDKVYDDALTAVIKAYYYNRASVALEPEYAGKFARPAGHADTVIYMHPEAADKNRPVGTVLSSPKGWYDAGDYNKYIVNSGITMFSLLKALQQFPKTFETLSLNIPESRNKVPDLLDEILWNLDWMETMQDPNDGGVYHKLSTLRFTQGGMPHSQYQARYMMPKSTAATLDFAAVMALASGVIKAYEDQFPGRAERYQKAAEKAWEWALETPKKLYYQPKDVNTGTYSRANDTLEDEWLWAAAELYILTGERKYAKKINFPENIEEADWGNVGMLGLFSLIDADKTFGKLQEESKTLIVDLAKQFVRDYWKSGYLVPLVKKDFVWGSNAVALNKAMVLIYANRLEKNKDYEPAARSLLDYIFGRNPTGYSFVTGVGTQTPVDIHHRPSYADDVKDPVPGFLAGGPQPGWQDKCKYPSRLPAKSYLDDWCSYSTNEIAINWNAALVYVITALR